MGLVGAARLGTRLRRIWEPCTALRPYVQSFELRDDRLGTMQIFNPLPARSDCFLQFHLKEPYRVVTTSTGEVHPSPHRVLVGPHTQRREDLIWTGDLRVFTIRFSPAGFKFIFGIAAESTRNIATNAELVLGGSVLTLEEFLAAAGDDAMPVVAERYLLRLLYSQSAYANAAVVLHMTAMIRRQPGTVSLNEVASRHNLGIRQMERLFNEFVGVTPRVFVRLNRLQRALALSRESPQADWSAIAASSNCFDQSHLIREFRALTGATPTAFAVKDDSPTDRSNQNETRKAKVRHPFPDPALRERELRLAK